MKKYKLTEEEQEILDYFEKGELLELPGKELENQKNIAKIAAANFFKKSERINIRLPLYDLNHIKRIAAQEGMPYQTLIASVLHKYASGYLKLDKLG
ncbi:CopG family antitoxin [Rickettsia tamurae]|uniref:CopG family antitoxin n=1 Tax=Rickettsia tamurae TaxID=334545 RepID=UPI00050A02BB|nr:CopG family antitoxin [Rickettsia tamurae]